MEAEGLRLAKSASKISKNNKHNLIDLGKNKFIHD